ncbi:MAG: hypothetical protein JW958_14040 [Candidatus Eisenbacteria bacterium]|nr:hypothetical protein [Candidatus Eisenbacteria bacterium]
MRGWIVFPLLIATVWTLTGCSTHTARIDYEGIEEFQLQTAPIYGAKELGEVKGKHRGPIWDGGDYAAHTAVWKMIRKARELNANAIGDIYWRDGKSPEPRCKKRWLYTLIFPPVLLTPFFMDAEVHGIAYQVEMEEAGLYRLPEDPAEESVLAKRIVEETRRSGRG